MRLALSILLAVTVSGCALLKTAPGPPPPAGKSPDAIRATAVVMLDSEKKVKGRAHITALSPEAFRVEVLSPFGTPTAVMLSDGETLSVLKNGRVNTYLWTDERLPYGFTAAELVAALLGRAPSGEMVTMVTDQEPRVLYNVTKDASGNVTEVIKTRDGQEVLVALFSEFRKVDGYILPHKISIRETGMTLEVRYTGVVVNPEIKEDIFRFKNGLFQQ